MGKYYYKKRAKPNKKKYLRLTSGLLILIGISIILYALLPIISWQIYFQPVFASQDITLSIPRANIVELARNSIDTTDYTKAENWFKNFNPDSKNNQTDTPFYTISVPKIKIEEAVVDTTVFIDSDFNEASYPESDYPDNEENDWYEDENPYLDSFYNLWPF